MTTTDAAIRNTIACRASDIVWWVNNAGDSFAAACARIKESSTLGPKAWDEVVRLAHEMLSK